MPVKVLCKVGDGIEVRTLHRGLAWRIYQLVQANREHLSEYLPWVQDTQGMKDTVRFFEQAHRAYAQGRAVHGAIWVDREVVGMMALAIQSRVDRVAHIGYWLSSGATGKGIVSRCLKAFVDYSFEEWDLYRIEILCATANEKSCRVAERAGFTHEGVLRGARVVNGRHLDMNVYSLLKPEWRAWREPTILS